MSDPIQDETDGHERRVQKILTQARHQVGVRDLLVFSFARMWTIVLAIGASMYALMGGWHESDMDRPNGKVHPKDKDQENGKEKGNR